MAKLNSVNRAICVLAAGLAAGSAAASGFEKSIPWGGRTAGLAGIGTVDQEGAAALYFNPAALAGKSAGQDLFFSVSPTQAQFKGPITNTNDQISGATTVTTPFALIYSATVDETWGFGVGGFVSGGANAKFTDIEWVANGAYKPEVKTDLKIFELSAGAGYRLNDKWRLGAAWRMVMAEADFSFVKRANAAATANAKLTGLKNTQSAAFRLGASYDHSEDTQIGLNFRSEVNFSATGRMSNTVFLNGSGAVVGGSSVSDTDAQAETSFPMALALGLRQKLNEGWTFYGEYALTKYSKINEIKLTSTGTPALNTNLATEWKDQHNLRLAAEMAGDWPLRFGYGYTSTVTDASLARASFTPPGPAHTLTVGTGQAYDTLRVDGAFEYTTVTGDGGSAGVGETNPTTNTKVDARTGSYAATAMVLHFGLTYGF
ncbi:MAG TPA: outer membrane protein transport protein [Pseudobdellovibrionaceae bacterium]|nr:outer membrane protein transport protein [Pseudobdellovibrionaceae bacterium]